MILSKAGRLSLLAGLLCLLLMGFTGAANAVIRWDVFPSPTEVINSGRSEVLGSVTLVVQANQPSPVLTGNISGGPTQLGILYNNRIMVDNTSTSGIRLFSTNAALTSALCLSACTNANTQFYVTTANIDITGTGQYAGLVTINIPGGISMVTGEVIRLDAVRGRIDKSDLAQPGTDGYCQLQSINDPAGNGFFPETIRIAKSFIPMIVSVTSDVGTLCLPTYGATAGSARFPFLAVQKISVTENFTRAFVAKDSNGAGPDASDRLDSFAAILGAPTQGTQLRVALNSIPASVTGVSWPATVVANGTGGAFATTTVTGFTTGTVGGPANGTAYMVYEYITSNQTGASDANTETFDFRPALALSVTNQQDLSSVRAGASLWPPPPEAGTGLYQPFVTSSALNTSTTPAMPRFVTNYLSGSVSATDPYGTTATTQFGIYQTFAPCVCYLLYPYTTKDGFWDTGIAVANTSDDTGVLAAGVGAARQAGQITFWLYDFRLGNVTPAAGIFFADAAHTVPLNVSTTSPAFDGAGQPIYYAGQSVRGLVSNLVTGAVATTLATKGFTDFAGYIIAKAQFQFCHGYAFLADKGFANIAQGYVAQVIPDPAVKGGRLAAAAGDPTKLPAGESLNN